MINVVKYSTKLSWTGLLMAVNADDCHLYFSHRIFLFI